VIAAIAVLLITRLAMGFTSSWFSDFVPDAFLPRGRIAA